MLSEKIERWEDLKTEISILEAEIKEEVLSLGKTQNVGNVRASFAKGRRSYNYEEIAKTRDIPEEILAAHTQQKTVTDWTKLVKLLDPPEEIMNQFVNHGKPSVTLKIMG